MWVGGRYNLSIIEAEATSPSKPPISSSQVSVLHIIHLFQHPTEISKKIFPKKINGGRLKQSWGGLSSPASVRLISLGGVN